MQQQQVDDWLHQQSVQESIFDRKIITFSNDIIEKNIDKLMQKPMLNKPIEDYDEQNQQGDEQETGKEMHQKSKDTNQQALYNPIQDQQNEKWSKKHLKMSSRPLNCPSCFNQISYDYEIQQNTEQQSQFISKHVHGATVKENKIIRLINTSQKMKLPNLKGQQAEKLLRQREQQFNVKILLQCDCGYQIGYFDVNKQAYVLLNAI